jgi:predicted N-formylglutamate amidohydrolase
MTPRLLAADEPPPVEIVNADGGAPVLLICDHASPCIPRKLANLGLGRAELERHIAWDIGAADATRRMAQALDAPALLCAYSRLVVDCNRLLRDPSLMLAVSDGTKIPGNEAMSDTDRAARLAEIYTPYHRAIEERAEAMRRRHGVAAVLAIHSCTETMNGRFRPWQIGICWERDDRIAGPVMAALRANGAATVGDNQPYALVTGEDCSLPIHAMRRGWPHLQVEFRQDLIATADGAAGWADVLIEALRSVLADRDLYQARFYD